MRLTNSTLVTTEWMCKLPVESDVHIATAQLLFLKENLEPENQRLGPFALTLLCFYRKRMARLRLVAVFAVAGHR